MYASVHAIAAPGDPGALIQESRSWSDPPLTSFDPPLALPLLSWVHLECDFLHVRDDTVRWGLGFTDEMCFFWAYYTSGTPRL